MPTFVVKVIVTKEEYWKVEAADATEATDNYYDGHLFDTTDEEDHIARVYPKSI